MALDNRKRFSSVDALKKFTPVVLFDFLMGFADYWDISGLKWDGEDKDVPYEGLVGLFMNTNGKAPPEFLTAIFYINALATDGGKRQIKAQAARDRVALKVPDDCTAHDFAFFAWKGGKDTELLAKALARGSGQRKRSVVTYQTDVPVVPKWDKVEFAKGKLGFEDALDDHFLGDQQGEGTVVTPYPDDEDDDGGDRCGDVWYLVRRGGGHVRQGVIESKKKSGLVDYTAELYDAAVYSPKFGELRVYGPGNDREAYRKAFGKLVGGADGFFAHTGLLTLDPLLSGKVEAISRKGFEDRIKWVRLVEVKYKMPGNAKEFFWHRAPDLFALVTEKDPLIPPGAVPEEATFELLFKHTGAVKHTLTIIPKDVARFTRDDDAPVIDAWLRAREFKKSFRPPVKTE